MISQHYQHAAVLLADGRVLVSGGFSDFGFTRTAVAEIYDPAANTWTQANDMRRSRRLHTATRLADGRVLMAGGTGSLASADIYDPTTDNWSAAGVLTDGRSEHTATLLPNGTVLVAGGLASAGYVGSSEIYNPATNSWSVGPALPGGRARHAATLLANGELLLAGGNDAGGPSNPSGYLDSVVRTDPSVARASTAGSTAVARQRLSLNLLANGDAIAVGGAVGAGGVTIERYSRATNAWTTAAAISANRLNHTATLLRDGRLLIAGGGGNVTAAVFTAARAYDPAADSWTTLATPNAPRALHTATLLSDGSVLLAGGGRNTDPTSSLSITTSSSERYDTVANSWTLMGNMADSRMAHTATLLKDGRVLVTGGFSHPMHPPTGVVLAAAEIYDPATGTWSAAANMSTPRMFHSATLLGDGRVLVAGGTADGAVALSSAEIYDPAGNTWSAAGNLIEARGHHSATMLSNGKVLVVGGGDFGGADTHSTASLEVFDPFDMTWRSAGSLAAPRLYHAAALLTSGEVLVVGGTGLGPELVDLGGPPEASRRPVVSASPAAPGSGSALTISGSGFRPNVEAAGGSTNSTASNIPVVQIMRVDNGLTRTLLASSPISNSSIVTAASGLAGFPAGLALVQVTVNGIPGLASPVLVGAPSTFTVTPAAGANGSISPNVAQTVAAGANAVFTVTPDAGYTASIAGTCGGSLAGNTYTTGAITANCTVAATFSLNTYSVTPSAGANGTISPIGAQTVNHGSTATFTVTPNPGYFAIFSGTCGGSLVGNTYTTNAITADCMVVANFAQITYNVTPSAGANGTISPSGVQAVNAGSTASFTVAPAAGYTGSVGGTCGGTLVGNTYTTNAVTADCTVVASFAQITYNVTPSAGANGSISPNVLQSIAQGGSATFAVTPNTGYSANVGGTCGGSLVGNTYTTNAVNADCTVAATFSLNTYSVTPSAGANGSISPNTAQIVAHGAATSFTVTANAGYTASVAGTCGGSLVGNTYTTNAITAPCTVVASFAQVTYSVTPSAGANGTISPNTAQTVASGGTATFTVTPNTGYTASVGGTCGGTLVGNTYTTNAITANCTVTASFSLNTYNVTPSAGANGSISPNTVQTVAHGATTTFTVTPKTG